jgi:UPF0716 protein FxsA
VLWLVFLFIALPVVEIALLIAMGRQIGLAATVGLLLVTALVGAFLARRQGLAVLRKMQAEMAAGRPPAGHLIDGFLILLAGFLLIVPGVLTDLLGFFCLLPAGRTFLKGWLRRRFEAGVRNGRIQVSVGARDARGWSGMRNVTPRQQSSDTKALGSGDET